MTYVRVVSRKSSRAENEPHGVRTEKKARVVCSLSKLSMLEFHFFFAPRRRWWPMRCLSAVLVVDNHRPGAVLAKSSQGFLKKIAKKMS